MLRAAIIAAMVAAAAPAYATDFAPTGPMHQYFLEEAAHGGQPHLPGVPAYHPTRVQPLAPPPGRPVYYANGERMRGCSQRDEPVTLRDGKHTTRPFTHCNLRVLNHPTTANPYAANMRIYRDHHD